MTTTHKSRWFQFVTRSAMDLLDRCCKTESERAYEQRLKSRPLLDDETFYETYYGQTGIRTDIPIRLRGLLARQLGDAWQRVQPADNVTDGCDVDLGEIVFEVEEEFGILIPDEEIKDLDGSFGSLVNCIARKLDSSAAT